MGMFILYGVAILQFSVLSLQSGTKIVIPSEGWNLLFLLGALCDPNSVNSVLILIFDFYAPAADPPLFASSPNQTPLPSRAPLSPALLSSRSLTLRPKSPRRASGSARNSL